MRVTGWFVEGFGILNAHEARELSGGLVLFGGPNEAGKSTLLAFLRGVLFGFNRIRGKREQYPPLAGGRHGGRVFLETAAGPVTIEREVGRNPRITLGDGSLLSDGDFQQLIGGVDAQTFRNVFAFSLDELHDIGSLSGEQVRARIFAAGVAGTGRPIRQVIDDLERTTDKLLKPRALDAEINSLLASLAARERELHEARLQAERYPDLLREEEGLLAQLAHLGEEEHDFRVETARIQRLLDLWPTWVGLDTGRRTLASLPVVDEFIADPIQRLAEAKQALLAAGQNLSRAEGQLRRKSAEAEPLRLGASEELWAAGPGLERQSALQPAYRERCEAMETAAGRVRLDEEHLRSVIRGLGTDLDESDLAAIDTSLPRLEQVREWRARLSEANERARQAASGVDAAAANSRRMQAECERQRETIESLEVPDQADVEAQAEAARTVRAGLTDLAARRAALDSRDASLRNMEALAGAPPGQGRRSVWSPAFLVTLACAVALVVAAALSYAARATIPAGAHNLSLALPLGAIALLLFIAAAVILGLRVTAGGRPVSLSTLTLLETERKGVERMRAEVDQAEAALAGSLGVLGLSAMPHVRELERIEEVLGRQKQVVGRRRDLGAELRKAEDRLRECRLDEEAAGEKLDQANQDVGSAEQDLRAQLQAWGLPVTLSPQGAEDYLRSVEAAKEAKYRLDQDRAALQRLKAEAAAWEAETAELLDSAGLPADAGEDSDLQTRLSSGAATYAGEVERRRQLSAAEESIAALEVETAQAKADVDAAANNWAGLLEQAGVEDEEAFRQKLAIYEDRRELMRKIGEAEAVLVARLGCGAEADASTRALETGDVGVWEERLQELAARLAEIKEARDTLIKEQGDIERRRGELEASADVPGLETVVAGLRTDLDDAVHRWRVHTLAAALVRDTLTTFTRERQPLVLAEASRMFSVVTDGRYERIVGSPDDEGVIVIDTAGREKTPDQLSRGTAEQLYLCLRLGLAEEFSRRAEPIPLVMDDVLVNFDRDRRQRTARLLLEFADRHQILLFTCHPEIEELILAERPETSVVRLVA